MSATDTNPLGAAGTPGPGGAPGADPLRIGDRELGSRLLLGTGGFRSLDALSAAIEASATELVAGALAGEALPDWARPADPARFAGVPA